MSPHRLTLAHDDFDAFAAEVPGFDLDVRQLDRGPFASRLDTVATPKVQVLWSRFSRGLEVAGQHPPGTLGFAVCARDDTIWTVRGMTVHGTDLMVAPAEDEVDMISRRDWSACVVSVDRDHLAAVQARTGLAGVLPTETTRIPLPPGALEVVRHLLGLVLSPLPGMDATLTLEEEIPTALLRLMLGAASTGVSASFGLADEARALLAARARDHIRRVARHAPTIAELESALGTSGRTLRRAFREHVGVSPKEYLHAQRLNGVRRDLRRMAGNVTEVAAGYGFWHMGQLAADYRRLFGELPSETLRASTGSARPISYMR